MAEQRIPLRTAERLAASVRNTLAATCVRVEIAGSIRRRALDVKDGEIVAIPTPATYRVVEGMVASGAWDKATYSDGRQRWGMAYRGIDVAERDQRGEYDRLRVELFFVDRDSWGYQLALRTGPGDANKRLMQMTHTTPIRCRDGAVWYADDWQRDGDDWMSETKRRVLLPVESAWFALWGLPFVPPELRTPTLYANAEFAPLAMTLGPAPIRQTSMFE